MFGALVMAEVIVLLNHTLIDALACFEVAEWRLFYYSRTRIIKPGNLIHV